MSGRQALFQSLAGGNDEPRPFGARNAGARALRSPDGAGDRAHRRRRTRASRSPPRPRPPSGSPTSAALGAVDLAITGRRAETLKARAYDGDVARVALPADADLAWVRATADPSADLGVPAQGAVRDPARRRGRAAPGGDRALQDGAPAAGGARRAAAGRGGRRVGGGGGTDAWPRRRRCRWTRWRRGWSRSPRRGCRSRSARPGGCGCSGRSTAPRSIMRSRSAPRTGGRRCSAGCIRLVLQGICSGA